MSEKIEITKDEYEEYKRLCSFFEYVQDNYFEVRLDLLKLKYIVYAGIKEDMKDEDLVFLIADSVSEAYKDANEMYDKIKEYPPLLSEETDIL